MEELVPFIILIVDVTIRVQEAWPKFSSDLEFTTFDLGVSPVNVEMVRWSMRL